MLNALIARTVGFYIRGARAVILLAIIVGVAASGYAAQHLYPVRLATRYSIATRSTGFRP